ncbi:hypothetical protein [Paraburkholderia sp. BL10I2N1]|uniref:hypothetical protein n=1 Tax=Paraburkholderia sp. BL10I2N1 TaxID=1938796 RepID=UPI001FB5A544|nr:hypothetical protein [Paraburkholderia sp. BL10I2N1]
MPQPQPIWAFCAAEIAAFPEGYYRAAKVRPEYSTKRELREFCSGLSEILVYQAGRRFAPVGGRLEIDTKSELESASIDIREALEAGKCPDFDAFWAHLERTFSGDAGQRVAFTQAAKSVINGFGLTPDSEIKRTASAIVLEARAGSELTFRSSLRRVGYYSQQSMANLIAGLAAFASHAGFASLGAQLARGGLVDHEFTTREKVSFPDLDLVLFNDKWQFKFSHRVGEALSLFISEYGAEHLASRSRY